MIDILLSNVVELRGGLITLILVLCSMANGQAQNSHTFRSELSETQSNILWMYLEDTNPWMSTYGDGVVEIPNIDPLASEGVRFDRAYMPSGIDIEEISVPRICRTDVPEVRSDIADYYREIRRFDQQVASAITLLKERDQLDNTMIMVMADNDWQMPRGLANLYDFGTPVPLIISWTEQFPPGRVVTDLVKLNDLAPTMLSGCGELL